ncbi:DUF4349 domain-containing protein [Kineococcus sp. LSe6-4]|uniref:DUF4349 domain-containing protein n=1 Tax=Kineococcus halophytocola TaxID=3234027 RepID=A0ABV4GY51_9ACTN
MRAPTPAPAPASGPAPGRAPGRARRWAAPALAPVLALGLLLGAAACTGGGADSAGSTGGPAAETAGTAGGGSAAQAGAAAQDQAGVDVAAPGRAVVSTATLAVRVPDVPAAVRAATARTTAVGGIVAASRSGGADGVETAHLTLRVPAPAYPGVLDDLAGLGRETDRTTTSTDVTAEVADVDSRVTSARAVLDTFRSRLPQATTIPDVLAVEGEIARREADLEALQARQRVLADQTALATVDVDLTRDAPPATATTGPGFLAGLAAGWDALGGAVRLAALVAGVLLPFLVPAAVVGLPLWWLVRRRRARSAQDPASTAP